MKNFLVGLSLGIGVGMLFAPMPGTDLRELAKVKGSEAADSARGYANSATETFEQARNKAENLAKAIRGGETSPSTGTRG